jgi:hypothetical protein
MTPASESKALRSSAIILGSVAAALSFHVDSSAHVAGLTGRQTSDSVASSKGPPERQPPADPGGYLPWSTSPSPLPAVSAYVGIGGAWGAGNMYNTATNSFTPAQSPGTGVLATGKCYFICFGAPDVASHHYLVYGNDLSSGSPGTSYTHQGAADDCFPKCPGRISNSVFGITVDIRENDSFLTIDGNGNVAVQANLYAGAAVVAGASSAAPSPLAGSLVSHTGAGEGDFIFGNAGAGNYVKCDFGETTPSTLTCDAPFMVSVGAAQSGLNGAGVAWATGGVQPNGTSRAYAPEVFPSGAPTPHPQIASGGCTFVGSATCSFLDGFSFPDTTYTCDVTAQATVPVAGGYTKSSSSAITIYTNSPTLTATFSYICSGWGSQR